MSGEIAAGEAVKLAEMVGYQDGSVVSRTLVKKEKGTVTLFAFAAGQGLSEHTAPFDALAMVVEGRGEFVIGGKAVQAVAGEAVMMPAQVPHAVKAAERFKMMLVMIRA